MPKILFVTPTRPFPADIGGRQRSALIARALARAGEVHLLIVDQRKPTEPELAELCERFPVVSWVPQQPRGALGKLAPFRAMSPRVIDRLSHNLGRAEVDFEPDPLIVAEVDRLHNQHSYDLFVGRYLRPACKAGLHLRTPSILDVDDLEVTTYLSRLPDARRARDRWVIRRHIRNLERLVPPLQRKFDHLWIASEADRELMGKHPSLSVLPNVMYSEADDAAKPLPPPPEGTSRLMVIASWNHPPNIRGISRFLEHSWPAVIAAVPEAELEIVGSMMNDTQRAQWGKIQNVIVSGRVDSVRDAYARCSASLCPVWDGGGTKIKILESLEFARTAVVAQYAMRGYEAVLRDEEHLYVAPNDTALADACIRALSNPTETGRLADAGRDVVLASYSRTSFARTVAETVKEAVSPGCRHDI